MDYQYFQLKDKKILKIPTSVELPEEICDNLFVGADKYAGMDEKTATELVQCFNDEIVGLDEYMNSLENDLERVSDRNQKQQKEKLLNGLNKLADRFPH